MNKKTILTVVAIAVLGTGALSASSVFAEDTASHSVGMSPLVQKIADKFNLNKSDVQAVFDEERTERQSQMEAKMEERLSTLVTEGKITEAQKQLLVKKHADLKAERDSNREAFRNLSADERKKQMDAKRTELETWAKENGIDTQYIMPFGMGKGMGGHRGN